MPSPRPSPAAPRAGPHRAARATAERVLDAAERLAQTRGYNGFSYADVSVEVGITTASLHYHFPTKADLGRALVERYTASFGKALAAIRVAKRGAAARLSAYGRVYLDVLDAGRMCLCGMLAAEYSTLPEPMRRAVRGFFDANEAWLGEVLEEGRDAGEVAFAGSPREAARLWASTLEGAMLLARSYEDPSRLAAATERLLRDVRPAR